MLQFRQWRNTTSATLDKNDVTQQNSSGEESERLSENPANFHPSIWGDFFLHYSNPATSSSQQTRMVKRADKLKEDVAKIVASSDNCSLLQRLNLIHVLERLCLDHLFEQEINGVLTQVSNVDISGCDLHTVALWFYLLRSHGYKVSPDVFVKFKDEEGSFASNNPRDLLSLYDAAYLRTSGEIILDEAITSTKRCLESILPYLKAKGSLACEIRRALEIPLPRRVKIYDAKYYISIYEKGTTLNKMILELAKLNSNHVQLLHQQELKIITRWWKNLQLEANFSFSRDRIVECYFWIVGVYFEPRYSRGRIILTMLTATVSILDDVYDVYGTSKDCELFTKCIERWDPKAAQDLPENMKFIFRNILDIYQTMEHELTLDEKYRMSYLRNVTACQVRAYNREVKWRDERYVPTTVQEHLQVSARSVGCHLLSCGSFVGMDDIATKESFDWVSRMPKIVHALCIIFRLLNDLKSYEREQKTFHVASTIDSCMMEHNVSMELARKKIKELVEESWKDLNEEWLKTDNAQPKELLVRILNLARTMEFLYKQDDAYTNSHTIKDTINSLFVESFRMI